MMREVVVGYIDNKDPLEKIGLIRREAHEGDARVSYVSIALQEAGRSS